MDGGGTSGNMTSLWLISWGANSVHGIYPKGSQGGLKHKVLQEYMTTDDSGDKFQCVGDIYNWKSGLAVSDWRAGSMLGIVNSGLGCLLYFSAVAKLPVQTVAVVGYLEPLSAVMFSTVLLGEAITPVRLMGATLIIGGALFCELAGKRADAKAGIAQTARA